MKRKLLLWMLAAPIALAGQAQNKKAGIHAYAITSAEKGSTRWSEVKLVDLVTGAEIRPVYDSKTEVPVLNARTKKPVTKKEVTSGLPVNNVFTSSTGERIAVKEIKDHPGLYITTEPDDRIAERKVIRCLKTIRSNAPFSTNSAACAYDKKHDRLYYTPMGINELRYIDLKSATPTIYYFEDEPLGPLTGPGDIQNQITRMAIASNGDGYALTNSSDHLIRFSTNKKAAITDLGALTDDPSNGEYSIHARGGYGGDMIADDSKNLFVVTANRLVFKVDTKTLVATYRGKISGLPAGFTTNGAAVEEGDNIIVTSSTNATAYYRFSLDNMLAEKISSGSSVYNASDLANGNLLSDRKVKQPVQETNTAAITKTEDQAQKIIPVPLATGEQISIYPNPVSGNAVKVSFQDYQAGNYEMQFMDLSGKFISSQAAVVNSKLQVQEFRLPGSVAKGTYILKVVNSLNQVVHSEKIIVQ